MSATIMSMVRFCQWQLAPYQLVAAQPAGKVLQTSQRMPYQNTAAQPATETLWIALQQCLPSQYLHQLFPVWCSLHAPCAHTWLCHSTLLICTACVACTTGR